MLANVRDAKDSSAVKLIFFLGSYRAPSQMGDEDEVDVGAERARGARREESPGPHPRATWRKDGRSCAFEGELQTGAPCQLVFFVP